MADLTSYLPMYTDPRLQQQAGGPLYANATIPLQNTGGVSGSWPVPAMAAPAAPAAAAPAMTAPAPAAAPAAPTAAPPPLTNQGVADFVNTVKATRTGRAGGATAMPKTPSAPVVPNQPAQPLIPGVTGFQVNDGPVVPYGTRFDVNGGSVQQLGGGGAGGGLYDNLPGGGKMTNGRFADPRDALEVGYRLQSQYRDESMRRILDLAGNGGDLGYRARVGALAQAFGQNNFGATSVGGANALNAAIAHVTAAGMGAGATMYASDNAMTTGLAGVGERAAEVGVLPHPSGAEPMYGPGGIPYGSMPTYSTIAGAPSYNTMSTTRPKAAPKEGATGTYQGKSVKYTNGEWQYAK